MLGFFSAKSDHPLADAKEAKRLYADISAAEPPLALDDATALLESLSGETLLSLEQRFDILQQLDSSTYSAATRFSRSYAAADLTSRNEELRLWRMGYGYWSNLSHAYIACLQAVANAPVKSREAIKSQLPLLCTLTLHALGKNLKWQQFRYGPLEADFWGRVGNVYLMACELDVAQKTCAPHVGERETTAEREYLKLLAFHASSMDSLLPQEIELADSVLDELLPQFQFSWQEGPDSVYWVDAAQELPPTRLAIKPPPATTLRYFNPGQALKAAQSLREEAENGGAPSINLGASYPATMVADVLDHLAMYWSPIPPQRSHPRHRVKSRMAVLAGLTETYRRLNGEARSSTEQEESWLVEDVSQGGLRAMAALGNNSRLSINTLLAMCPEGGSNWLLGVVRRFSRETESSGSVGVETLAKQPQALSVDSGGIRTEVIMLDPWETSAQVRLVLPARAWEDKIAMTFVHTGRTVKLVPDAQVQTGPDYLIGRYKVRIAE